MGGEQWSPSALVLALWECGLPALGLGGPVPALSSLDNLTPQLPWLHRLNLSEPRYSLPLPGLGLTGSHGSWLFVCYPDSPLWGCVSQLLSTAWGGGQSLLSLLVLDTSLRLDICFLTPPYLAGPEGRPFSYSSPWKPETLGS